MGYMKFQDQLSYRYKLLNSPEKLILINVICFVLPLFFKTIFFLFNIPFTFFSSWFNLTSDWSVFLFQPWTILTYSFLHSGFFHLFWNMYLLFFASRIFLNLLPSKTFLSTYFLGVVIGGFTFLVSYSLFPAFINSTPRMVGASAGVMAILVFIATFTPEQEVRLIFFNIKLQYIGLAFVLLDVIQIPYGNAGGHLAHLGGASLGFLYAYRLKQGIDIGLPFDLFINKISVLFSKKTPLKTVFKNQKSNSKNSEKSNDNSHQKSIDIILDKISDSGYDSLSKEEKEFLFKAGKK